MKAGESSLDAEIIRNLKNDDAGAMGMLYKLHWKALYISAYNILKDKGACEDIIQELFIRIWNSRKDLNITSSLQAYLSAATRYEVYRKLRENKRYEPIVDEMVGALAGYSGYGALEFKELQSQINTVVDTLSPKCRNVYILSRNEQLSHKEIAGKLKISTNTVRNHLTHALHHVREGIDQAIIILLIILIK
ncbi:sigma-70 family RNA polymerase sigma factor [Flavitalea sp. BT771]|uniref:RNA polymerase sigma factor n=1 Tax=Flavitalea sp. BT771 TaxID=3063329 RepID=UPI0026E2A70F|nr:sigma-70 family RNA polymerase sigma factor [Flavitalea sp. BT771]MDO6429596.1 sigma-70 family RNA polymerase sigma factor [Flavitalea sp. BT771]MDV6218276.1 sigma-70 family RNA polymerase sigma factor [Flavitalea sp. BT771]